MTASNQRIDVETENFVAHTLKAQHDGSSDGVGSGMPIVAATMRSNGDAHSGFKDEAGLHPVRHGVRRYTPQECEVLQGFPIDHTKHGVDEKGKAFELADGPRYMALGNAVTVNVGEWLGRGVPLTPPSTTS